jgi:uncharacterized membrane protein YhaH (DUF805 family)
MYCKNCGNQLSEGAAVCLKCGVQVGKGNKYCAHCGAQPDPLASICVSCGHSLKGKTSNQTNEEGSVDSLGGAIKSCFNKYATFQGRANRSEYWFWILFTFLCGLIPFLGYVAMLAFLIPGIAVCVRRLHDIGKSGWNYFFCLIPILGSILLIVWLCQPSQEGDNEYGPNPNY